MLCEGFVNPWGHHFDRWGQSFATDGAYGEGVNYVFPGAVFVTAPGARRIVAGLNPGSPKHCGLEILSGRHLPNDWSGSMITNDFRAHRVCRFVVTEDKAGYASRQEQELIKSSHVAFRPVDVKMGPDGAIYIADWYNPIIQHGEVDFRDPRRDHVHGRIWRVTAKGRPLTPAPVLAEMSLASLLAQLKSPEDWVRLHAKYELRRFPAGEVATAIDAWLKRLSPDDDQSEHARLEALWARQLLDLDDAALLESLATSSDHRARAAAIRVSVDWAERLQDPTALWRSAIADAHPRVRLEAVRAFASRGDTASVQAALAAMTRPVDRFLDFALWRLVRDSQDNWLPRWESFRQPLSSEQQLYALAAVDSPAIREPLKDLLRQRLGPSSLRRALAMLAQHGGPAELGFVLKNAIDAYESDASASKASEVAELIDALVATSRARKLAPQGDLERLHAAIVSPHVDLRAAAARAIGAWRVASLRTKLEGLRSQEQPLRVRLAAIEGSASFRDEAAKSMLQDCITHGPEAERPRALAELTPLAPRLAAKLASDWLSKLQSANQAAIDEGLGELLARKVGAKALAEQLNSVQLAPDSAQLALRAAQKAPEPSEAVLTAIRKAGKLVSPRWEATPEVLAELSAAVSEQGDSGRGEVVYRRTELQCQKCHAIAGAGGRVGPDLLSIGGSAQIDYLLESLLDPNRKVKENYHGLIVVTDEGKSYSGVVVRQDTRETRAAHRRRSRSAGREVLDRIAAGFTFADARRSRGFANATRTGRSHAVPVRAGKSGRRDRRSLACGPKMASACANERVLHAAPKDQLRHRRVGRPGLAVEASL